MAMVMESTKACTKCGIVKPLSDYPKRSDSPDGYRKWCKPCEKARKQKHYQENNERIREKNKTYYLENRDELCSYYKAKYASNKEEVSKRRKEERITKSEEVRNKDRAYYSRNKKRINEKNRRWRENNVEKARADNRDWYRSNSEKVKQNVRVWRKNNPEKNRDNHQRRKARRKQAGVFQVTKVELKNLYSSPCACCGSTEQITADHIIPIARGGRHAIGNLQPLCLKCNLSKNDKLMIEWKLQKRKEAMK